MITYGIDNINFNVGDKRKNYLTGIGGVNGVLWRIVGLKME